MIVRDRVVELMRKKSDGIPVNASGESEIDLRTGKNGSGLSGNVKSSMRQAVDMSMPESSTSLKR